MAVKKGPMLGPSQSVSRKRATQTVGRVHEFQPVGLDAWDPKDYHPTPGTPVRITQPSGTPKNGTMRQTYIEHAETGEFLGMVNQASLIPHPAEVRKRKGN